MKRHLSRLAAVSAFVSCCVLTMASPVKAETDSSQDSWAFGGSAYLWAAGVEGTSVTGDEIDISFADVLDNLDGGLMGVLAARKGRWTLIADLIYLSIHDETSSTENPIGNPATLDLDVNLKGFISTFGVAYRIIDDDRTSLDLLAGARYTKMDLEFSADNGIDRFQSSDSEDALDGIIGTQAIISLNEKWYFSFYADIGSGDSKRTWQVWPGVGYMAKKVDVVAGYRHLEWDIDNGDTYDDLNFSGPMFGVKFRF